MRASGCQIGGSGQGDGNVVTAASGSGIVVEQGGTDVIGNEIKGNAADGVRVTAGMGTRLIGNTRSARTAAVASPSRTARARCCAATRSQRNGGLGIDVAPDGVTADTPVLSAVGREGGKLRLTGTLPAPVAGQHDPRGEYQQRLRPERLRRGRDGRSRELAVLAAARPATSRSTSSSTPTRPPARSSAVTASALQQRVGVLRGASP